VRHRMYTNPGGEDPIFLMSNPNSRSRSRAKVPGYVKLPKFLTSKDVDRLVRMKETEPTRLWSELVTELVESKFQ
jgi:hypothetical protein